MLKKVGAVLCLYKSEVGVVSTNRWFFALLIFIYCTPGFAQRCSDGFDPNDTSFIIKSDGTVTDKSTGLVWWRCPLGMKFDANNDTCSDVANRLFWTDAKYALEDINSATGYANSHKWRLPTLKELLKLVEMNCYNPTINSKVFPNTPPTGFWTSTPNNDVVRNAWLVYFLHGSHYTSNTLKEWVVRPVRD